MILSETSFVCFGILNMPVSGNQEVATLMKTEHKAWWFLSDGLYVKTIQSGCYHPCPEMVTLTDGSENDISDQDGIPCQECPRIWRLNSMPVTRNQEVATLKKTDQNAWVPLNGRIVCKDDTIRMLPSLSRNVHFNGRMDHSIRIIFILVQSEH
jgi:hypothetical protein